MLLKQSGANDAPAEGDKCRQSNNAGPMLPNTVAGAHPKNSACRSAVLTNISRSWTALANQLESLLVIEKLEAM
jgi:hypothetical protein